MGLLRFLLALAVIITHSTPILGITLVPGEVAVKSFFIISGFYMSFILNEKYIGEKGSYKLFIVNRFLRLYPLYWIVLAMTFTLFLFSFLIGGSSGTLQLYFDQIKAGTMDISTLLFLFLSNIFIIGQDGVMFLTVNAQTGMLKFTNDFAHSPLQLWHFLFIPQAWSLAIEILFYLVAPFILRKNILLILILFLCSLSLRIGLYLNNLNYDPWEDRFFLTELAFFLAGNFSYKIYKKYATIDLKKHELSLYLLLTILLIFTLVYQYIPTAQIKSYAYYILVVLAIPFLFKASSQYSWDRYIGELSYPIYISHIFLRFIVNASAFPKIESVGTTLAIVTILFSIFLYHFFGKPIEKIRNRRISNKNLN